MFDSEEGTLSLIWFGSLRIVLFFPLIYGLMFYLFHVLSDTDFAEISGRGNIRLSVGILYQYFKRNFRKILVLSLAIGLVFGLITELIAGLVFGLLFVMTSSLAIGFIDQLDALPYLKITTPYQRFKSSAKVFYFSIIQHWHLRHLLAKKDLFPRKLVHFLNQATENNILESDGGSWRFRHRILQEYFVGYWEETNNLG